MAQFTITIKDDYVAKVAQRLGFYPSKQAAPADFEAAIQSKLEEFIDNALESVVRAEEFDKVKVQVDAAVSQKMAEAKQA